MKRKSHLFLVMYSALLFILTFFALSIISPSCKKMEVYGPSDAEIQSRFFAVPLGAPTVVHKIASALKKQNDVGGFIPSFAKTDGYALWDKAQIKYSGPLTRTYGRGGEDENSQTIEVFIPVGLDNDHVLNGFFFSRIVGDSVELHLYRANDFDLFPYGSIDSTVVTAERVAFKMMELDFSIYGARNYTVDDDSIFKAYFSRINAPSPKTISFKPEFTQAGKQIRMCVRMQGPECTCVGGVCVDWETCDACGYWYCFNIGSPDPPTGGTSNWPPDPPINTGAGGTGGSENPSGNCVQGNCRTNSTLISEGRLPCGGCGDGPISVPGNTNTISPTTDSCEIVLPIGLRLDTLYNRGRVDSVLATIPAWQSSDIEMGIAIYKTFSQNSTTGIVTINRYFPGPLIQGDTLSAPIGFPARNDSTRGAAEMHIHTRRGNAGPSPGDIIKLIDRVIMMNHSNQILRYEGTFVAAFNDNRYAIVVSDLSKLIQFNTYRDAFYDTLTHDWKLGSTISHDRQLAFNHFDYLYNNLADTPRQSVAYELSLAAMLSKYDTGINLFKRDSNGHFKPVIVTVIPHPAMLGRKIYTIKCP